MGVAGIIVIHYYRSFHIIPCIELRVAPVRRRVWPLSGVRSEFPGLGYDNFQRFVALVYHQSDLKDSNCQVVAPLERGESCSFVKCIPNQSGVNESDPRIGSTRHGNGTCSNCNWAELAVQGHSFGLQLPSCTGWHRFPWQLWLRCAPLKTIGTRIELQWTQYCRWLFTINLYLPCGKLPVVPHKALAEVSE